MGPSLLECSWATFRQPESCVISGMVSKEEIIVAEKLGEHQSFQNHLSGGRKVLVSAEDIHILLW